MNDCPTLTPAPGLTLPMTDAAVVPVAYAALGFVIGVLVGLMLRRTVAAMAVTLLVAAAVQLTAPPVLHDLLAQPVTSITVYRFDH